MVQYSYNGTILPALPSWDKEAYPYAVIGLSVTNIYYLCCANYAWTALQSSSGASAKIQKNQDSDTFAWVFCKLDTTTGEWTTVTNGNSTTYLVLTQSKAVWANADMVLYTYDEAGMNKVTDGSVYLPASYPINPETGEEIRIYDPIPVGSAPDIEPKAFMNGYLAGQKVRALRRKLTNTEDITDAELIDGVLYIRNANAKQLNDILEVT